MYEKVYISMDIDDSCRCPQIFIALEGVLRQQRVIRGDFRLAIMYCGQNVTHRNIPIMNILPKGKTAYFMEIQLLQERTLPPHTIIDISKKNYLGSYSSEVIRFDLSDFLESEVQQLVTRLLKNRLTKMVEFYSILFIS